MRLYSGIDLHSNNNYVAILDEDLQVVVERRQRNDLAEVLATFEPYRGDLVGIAVESTFNWYWLVDGLMAAGYQAHLVNTSAVVQYSGLKYTDDKHDARWLARLLRLGILPEGYIYPKASRGLRDLLRRRAFLVRKRTSLLLSSKAVYTRGTGERVSANSIKRWDSNEVRARAGEELALSIDCCLAVIVALTEQIRRIERYVLERARLEEPFDLLKGIGGIGDTLALTIMYEVGEIERFPTVGDFASYCRCVSSQRVSNQKRKGKGNVKNGNAYLSWAFAEAAVGALRFEPRARRWYERKMAKTMQIVALRALAHKLSRACYYVLRDRVPFDSARAFG